MNPTSASMSVAVGEHSACIKIAGRANFTSSIDFKALVNELVQRGCRCFVLDLSDCVLMDSTFLGVLASFGLKLRGGNGDGDQPALEIYNPNPRIIDLLETLGVLHLFKIASGALAPSAGTGSIEQTPSQPGKAEVTRTCLEAHQTLMDINSANAAKFKDVAQFLAENLKKLTTP
jgi:anti-sigma B factor antagonist